MADENKELLKPVWRVNKFEGTPNDVKIYGEVVFRGGDIEKLYMEPDEYWWEISEYKGIEIIAYQTTRTKLAKYERVDCRYCLGSGIFKMPYFGYENDCSACNGKGYTLEAIE